MDVKKATALVVAAAVLVVHQWRLQPWTLDDAFISMRYARNLAHGSGLVYNPGDPVEGYTNFLWTVLLAPAALVEKDLVVWAKVLGLACTASALALVATADRWLPGISNRAAVWSVLLLGTSGIFTRWSMSGMEVPLVAALVLGALGLHAKDNGVATGIVAGIAGLARPDANLVIVPILVDAVASRRPIRGRLAGYVAVLLPYTAWRLWTYGDLLPNTFYVKVGATAASLARGAYYLNDFLGLEMGLVVLVALGVFGGSRLLAPGLRAFVGYLVLHTLYVVAVGGDVFWGLRFFATVLPVLAVCAGVAVEEARRGVAAGALTLALHGASLLTSHQLGQNGEIGSVGERIGLWLRACAPPDAVLAMNIAGAVPYYSRLETIDMLGLNDRHIAHREMPNMGSGAAGHEKGDGAYVLSRKPDYVILGEVKGRSTAKFVGDQELLALPAFRDEYALTSREIEGAETVRIWVRRDGKGICDAALSVTPAAKGSTPAPPEPFSEKRIRQQYDTGR